MSEETGEDSEYTNPPIISSARTTISQTDIMKRYYGDICRNIDSAFVLCGTKPGELCRARILDCPFEHVISGNKTCRLYVFMELVESSKTKG